LAGKDELAAVPSLKELQFNKGDEIAVQILVISSNTMKTEISVQ
jgi:hypothetical protein